MKKILFVLIPSGVVILYILVQSITQSLIHKMYFSSNFAVELVLYALFGLVYMSYAFRINLTSYKWLATFGFILGISIFILVATKLFLNFEFFRNLSI